MQEVKKSELFAVTDYMNKVNNNNCDYFNPKYLQINQITSLNSRNITTMRVKMHNLMPKLKALKLLSVPVRRVPACLSCECFSLPGK